MENDPSNDAQAIKPCPQCGTGVKFRVDLHSSRRSCPHCGYVLPTRIAHFKLVDIIGAGGMGAVYRGLDTSLERSVAVKVMREDFANNPQFVENFLREARAAAALNHPSIAQIYSFGEQNGRYYLVMELLPGGSLDDRIEEDHRLSELEALDIGIHIANGLRAAHERGLIHRDIKPGNILFAQDGSAKLVDFGLARFAAKSTQAPKEEGIWGTPYYIAPEKVSDNKEDFRSDIYSLGGTLFHAIAGRAPFEAGTSTEVVLKHLRSPAVSLRAFAPDCTSQTAEVIGRMLKRDPADRPQTYDELLNDFAYAKRFALEKKPPEHVEAESDVSVGMLVGTILLMVLCVALGVWFWFHRTQFLGESGAGKPDLNPPGLASNPPPTAVETTKPSPSSTPPSKPPPPDYALQMEQAHDAAGRGQFAQALGQFENIQRNLPPDHDLLPWARLDAAQTRMLLGRDSEANPILSALMGTNTPDSLEKPVPPARYPAFAAMVLTCKIPDEELEKWLEPLPKWMRALARFEAGLADSRQDRLAETANHWKLYAQSEVDDPHRWAYAYQPMAHDFVDQFEQFRSLEKDVETLKAASKFQEIQQLLQDSQARWQSPLIIGRVKQFIETNRQAMAALQRAQEEKRKADTARLSETEQKMLDAVRAKEPQLMANYQFEALLAEWKALEPQIKIDQNRRVVQYHMAVHQCLSNFRADLIQDIQSFPYDRERMVTRGNLRMVGKLYQVKDGKLWFRKELGPDQMAEMSCRWQDITPSSFLDLGDYYIDRLVKRPEPNNSDIARRAVALAVFAREYALPDNLVNRYLGLAEQTGANVRDMIQKLFPAQPSK